MAIVITGNGIDMGNNPVSNASQIDGVVINENGSNVRTESDSYSKTETDGKIIGIGQTWQNVAASRSIGVTYTNSTGKSIFVIALPGDAGVHEFYVDAVKVDALYVTAGTGAGMCVIVPNGSTYRVTGGTNINTWAELR